MMDEPWYQTTSVSMEEAKREVKNSVFCRGLYAQENTFDSNQVLARNIREMNDTGLFSNTITRGNPGAGYMNSNQVKQSDDTLIRIAASNASRVTYESLRFHCPNWRDVLERIIDEELQREHDKYNGFGSHRGFYTFVFKPLCNIVMARAIIEMWAVPTMKKWLRKHARSWIEQRFAPDGVGFQATATHFNHLVAKECFVK